MGVHEVETRLPLPFMFFCPELENGISKFFTNLKKKSFRKKLPFPQKLCMNQFPLIDTCLELQT